MTLEVLECRRCHGAVVMTVYGPGHVQARYHGHAAYPAPRRGDESRLVAPAGRRTPETKKGPAGV